MKHEREDAEDMDFDEDEEGFFMSSAEFDEFEWLESIYACAIIPSTEEETAAWYHAMLIRRHKIIDNFYDPMEEPTEWTWKVSAFHLLYSHWTSRVALAEGKNAKRVSLCYPGVQNFFFFSFFFELA